MKQGGQPTMKDVAREAGVSLGTVSRVVNGLPVGESYRLRVEAAIRSLDYRVNSYARGLKTNRTYCVALVMPSLRHPFYALLTDELTACLMRRGYRPLLMITNFDPEAERKSFALVQQNKVDGIIALTYSPDLEVDDDMPVVTIDRHFGDRVPCVSADNFRGGQMAVEKLLALGCRRLLFLRIGPHILGEADRRAPGFAEACQRLQVEHAMLSVSDEDTVAPIFQYLEEHVEDGRLAFDGIFCNTDGLAIQVCAFLEGLGVAVPDAVQVIGFDGILNYASGRYFCSTIVQPVDRMAQAAVELLLDPAPADSPVTLRLPVRYAPGGTTRES